MPPPPDQPQLHEGDPVDLPLIAGFEVEVAHELRGELVPVAGQRGTRTDVAPSMSIESPPGWPLLLGLARGIWGKQATWVSVGGSIPPAIPDIE